MNRKNLVVTFCMFALALFLIGSVSAGEVTSNYQVTVDGIGVAQAVGGNTTNSPNTVSVVAGEEFTLKVYFLSDVNDTDVTLEATVEGEKVEFDAQSAVFDVEAGHQYKKVLTLKVPYELKDDLSDNLVLSIELDGKDHKTTLEDITLRVQRPSYNVRIASITTPSTISAGQEIPVEIVLKNIGYNDLDDVYASVVISELGVAQGPKWFGDLVTLEDCENDCDEEDTVVGTLYLKVPYEAASGVYTLEVVVQNGDLKAVSSRQIAISNTVPDSIVVPTQKKTVSAGEEASFIIVLVNPTDNVKVYRILTDSGVTPSQSVVAVPAGSSATVTVTGSSNEEGEHLFNVNIFDGNTLVKTVPLELDVKGGASSNAIIVLTIVLAVIFLVLLIVLIVLLSKKPEKQTEDFGESYY